MSYLKLNAIPSSNAVYVDNDYIALRTKGLLAYRSLEEAVISWRTGGEARIKYGTPTATNRGAIILGAGRIEAALSTTSSEVDINVDYLNVVGQGKDATIVTTSNSMTQSLLAIAATNINFFNFTLFGSTTTSSIFRMATSTYAGTWHNVKITGDANAGYVQFLSNGDMLGANFFDCEFDFSAGTATPTAAMTLGFSNGASSSFKFYNCIFKGNSSVNKILSITGRVDGGNFIDCSFSGSVVQYLVEDGTTFFIGTYKNCIFDSTASTSAVGLRMGSADPETIVQGCYFVTRGSCVSGIFSNRTRLINNLFICFGSNTDAISANSAIGLVVYGCRIVTQGTGLAINADAALTAQISNCTMRKPTSNTPGSSIGSNITNLITMPFNSEVDSSVNY